MALFDFLAKKPHQPAPEEKMSPADAQPAAATAPAFVEPIPAPRPRQFAVDRAKMYDLSQTTALQELLSVPRAERTARWVSVFFAALWNASLETPQPPVFHGPDTFPYLRLHLPVPGERFTATCLAGVAQSALDQGLGVAVFASPDAAKPEYVLPMGVLDSLITYDSWLGDPIDLEEIARDPVSQTDPEGMQVHTTRKEEQILVGSPAATFLPPHTARALERHLRDGWKIAEPRIALMINPSLTPTRSLVINRRMSGFPDAKTAGLQGRFLLWYLPPRRSLLLMPESWNDTEMKPLTGFFPARAPRPDAQ